MLKQYFQMFARYNSLANHRLYEVCAQLDDVERKCIRPAFFKSIHGTLNHIMVGDRIWMARFEGKQMPSTGGNRDQGSGIGKEVFSCLVVGFSHEGLA